MSVIRPSCLLPNVTLFFRALEKAQQQVADLQTALEKSWRDLAEQKKNMSGQVRVFQCAFWSRKRQLDLLIKIHSP